MNYAKLDKSERLQRALKFLRRNRRWVTTREIVHGADVCAVNSIIAELRLNGFAIPSRPKGRGVYEYKYEGRAA